MPGGSKSCGGGSETNAGIDAARVRAAADIDSAVLTSVRCPGSRAWMDSSAVEQHSCSEALTRRGIAPVSSIDIAADADEDADADADAADVADASSLSSCS